MVFVQKGLHDYLEGHFVVGNLAVLNDCIRAGFRMLDPGTLNADPFHEPLCQDRLVGHVKKLVFEG
ncbi:hypothetical protein MASR2M79_12320 [Aminivibrio sp.]